MILRRLSTAFRKQDWATVLVETLIVVFGVFIGLQVNNWNAARQDKVAFHQALSRLGDELRANVENSRSLYDLFVPRMATVQKAIIDLRACDTSTAAEVRVNAALNAATNTLAVEWQFDAIDKLASDPALLSQQSQDRQKLIAQIRREIKESARYIEMVGNLLNEDWLRDEPLSIGRKDLPVFDMSADSEQLPFQNYYRELTLGVSLEEACIDRELMKHFHGWEDGTMFMMLMVRRNNLKTEAWLNDLDLERAETP